MRWPWSRKPDRTFDSAPRPLVELFAELQRASGKVTRSEALSVPAVQRGRNMICSIATLPLVQHAPDRTVVRGSLFEQIDPDVPNVVTLAQTLEDLIFESVAWWLVTSWDFAGFPVSARHLDVGSVSVQPPKGHTDPLPSGIDPRSGVVWVDGEPVTGSRIIRFDSPNPAVLKVGGRAIHRAILLDKAAAMYADDPRPLDYFAPAQGADEIDDDEIKALLAQWKAARKRRSTAYVPASLTYNTVASPSPAELQLAELQKQAGLDIANAFGVDPEDLGISTTSRTYANAVDRRRDRINDVLAPYMRAITDRLSMGDVTRRGYRVLFDLDDYMKSNPTERWSTYQTAHDLGVLDVDEIREREGLPARAGDGPAGDAQTGGQAAVDAARPAGHTFDAGLTFADVPVETFSVDREGRVIEGMALPYNRVASQGVRFERGSLQWAADSPGRVKLLRDHDPSQPLGKAIQLRDTPKGLLVRFKVAKGAAGDEALDLADDGVLDGMSVGVDFDAARDTVPDPRHKGVVLVRRADLREVSLTAMPSFDDARVTSVAASRTTGGPMADDTVVEAPEAPADTDTTPDPAPVATFTAEQVQAMLAVVGQPAASGPQEPAERPAVVNPTRTPVQLSNVREAVPYRFDRAGRFVADQEHVFSADLHDMALARDNYGTETEAGRRVMGLLRATFDVDSADINELTPNIQRPDMYVDQRDYRYPLWQMVNKGAPPNGIQPFTFPKFSSASGLVGDHTEGVEPSSGTFVATNQTVTPSAVSGKASITREVWDMGGNPAVSTLVFNQMVRGYREGLESAAATFLNTLTAATDLTITAAATDDALAASWEGHLAGLQFVRGYDFDAFAIEQVLYKAFAAARDDVGRPLYPIIAPQNANGTAQSRFRALDLGGVIGVPSWALPSTAGSSNNSWLFDSSTVHGWATAPQRLEFPGTGVATTDDSHPPYSPVAMVDLAIWGYKAFACSDIGGVRQVTYDSTT